KTNDEVILKLQSLLFSEMEVPSSEEILQCMSSSLSQIKWRLKASSKRRLDIALCTGMRPVVMIDYGGKLPELQTRLLSLLELLQEVLPVFKDLMVMVIEDMIYLINGRTLPNWLSSEPELFFLDLEQDPPQMVEQSNNDDHTPALDEANSSQSSLFIDLSCCLQDTKVTIPTLSGWLLDYPVVYLFGTDHIEDAIYNLSTKSLRIFKVLLQRNGTTGQDSHLEELTSSFSVPYELSGKNANISVRSLDLQVSECYPQAISWNCSFLGCCNGSTCISKPEHFSKTSFILTERSSTMLQSKAPTYESPAPVVSTASTWKGSTDPRKLYNHK
ncbi:hypothetical protein HID58_060668, partial [Brassica napus]